MEDRIRTRLDDLQKEYKKGQEELNALQVQLYAYQGAIAILHEMLQPGASSEPTEAEEGVLLG